MEYLALYRKYRPKELDEVVGQSEVKKILASSVKNGTITHAYLFSGPRGTGKTTMAKILAKMVNCKSPVDGNACNNCDSCKNILTSNDVIEIDAASNNGVDEIRDLREKANLVPTSAKYKVYIIDEVHMLTTQAFNALLKTLEEPPKHVIFVLATTEYYKIPLTITSRCQKFQFNKINNDDIVNRLREIAKLENIEITDEALFEIAKISDGGMRDSINFLDQLRSFNDSLITINDVYDVCGNVSISSIVDLLNNIRYDKTEEVIAFFESMNLTGKNYGKFFEDLISFLKDVILFKKNVNHKYIYNDIDFVKNISNLYKVEEIFLMIENINDLMDKIKNISRQSFVITSNMLLLMHKLNNNLLTVDKYEKDNVNKFNNDEIIENKLVNNIDDNYTIPITQNTQQFTDKNINNKNDEIITDNNKNKSNTPILIPNKDIIINNTFATASKNIKNNLQSKLAKASDYLTDTKYMQVAGAIMDTKIEVAGDGYLILSALNDGVIDKIYNNYHLCCNFLNLLLEGNYNYVVINFNEWEKLRDEYISNVKKGIKYQIKELDNTLISDNFSKNEITVVDKLFELVGEDVIEFKNV